jgi:hypothetical protein
MVSAPVPSADTQFQRLETGALIFNFQMPQSPPIRSAIAESANVMKSIRASQLHLQRAHEVRQSDLPFALASFRGKDGTHLGESLVDV